MTVIEDLTGFTSGTSQNQTLKNGVKFTSLVIGTLTQIKKFSTCEATTAYILDSNKAILATATFVGDIATFSLAIYRTYYYACVDKGGASYDRRYNAGQSYPIAGTNINYIDGLSNGNDVNSEVNSITSVSTEGENVNPNKGTKGTKEIDENWPGTSGTTTNTKHAGRQINLVAEGIHGIKTTTLKKDREGL